MRTIIFDGEISRWTKPSPRKIHARQQLKKPAPNLRRRKRRQAAVVIDRKRMACLRERHALDPLHNDGGSTVHKAIPIEARKPLEARKRTVTLVLLAKRDAQQLVTTVAGGSVFIGSALGHDESLACIAFAQRVGYVGHAAQTASARTGLVCKQGCETTAAGIALPLGKRCGGFKFFYMDNAQRTSRLNARVRSLENLFRHSTIPARLGPYSARYLFWPLSFIVSVSGCMNSLTC